MGCFKLVPTFSGTAEVILMLKWPNATINLANFWLRKLVKLPGLSEIRNMGIFVLRKLGGVGSEGEFSFQQLHLADQKAVTVPLIGLEKRCELCKFGRDSYTFHT